MNYFKALEKIQNHNFQNINLGNVFINDMMGVDADNVYLYYYKHCDIVKHFDKFSNWYLPFDTSTCLIISDGNIDKYRAVTFTKDNKTDNLLGLNMNFSYVAGIGTLQGSLKIMLSEDMNDAYEEQCKKDHVNKIVVDIGFEANDDMFNKSKYRLLCFFDRYSFEDRGIHTYDPITKIMKSNGDNEFPTTLLGNVASDVGYAFTYFSNLMMDTKIFVIEERIASMKREIKIKKDKPSLFHIVNIDTIRKCYIQSKAVQADTEIKSTRAPHERRRHKRVFRSDYYTHRKGETIIIDACWIGPIETYDNSKQRLYKVRLDIG